MRSGDQSEAFIEAKFELTEQFAEELAKKTGATAAEIKEVLVARKYNGGYIVSFPNDKPLRNLPREEVEQLLTAAVKDIATLKPCGRPDPPLLGVAASRGIGRVARAREI
jgi:hypothetical protein